jgi:hypothetical protein
MTRYGSGSSFENEQGSNADPAPKHSLRIRIPDPNPWLLFDCVCRRLIVTWTEDERVEKGSLYLVTYKGGSVGSKGEHEVILLVIFYVDSIRWN